MLYFERFSADDRHPNDDCPIVIVPGLFGSTPNWRSFARRWLAWQAQHQVSRDVIVVDQRNHGRSPHFETNSYAELAHDLLILIDALNLQRVVLCGHSMGGKTAMAFALWYPNRVEAMAILDILPKKYPDRHQSHIDAMTTLDLDSLGSRKEAESALAPLIPDQATRLFLLQSLSGRAGRFEWRLNLPVLAKFLRQISDFPIEDVQGLRFDRPCLLAYGEQSEYVNPIDISLAQRFFPKLDVKAIAKAGHWLHIQEPESVLEALVSFVKKRVKK